MCIRDSGYTAPSWNRSAMCCQSYFCLLDVADCNTRHIFHHRVWYHVLALCYVCIRSSGIILTPRLPLCKISFLSQPPLLRKLAHSINQSLSHSPSLFDAPGTKAHCETNKNISILMFRHPPSAWQPYSWAKHDTCIDILLHFSTEINHPVQLKLLQVMLILCLSHNTW